MNNDKYTNLTPKTGCGCGGGGCCQNRANTPLRELNFDSLTPHEKEFLNNLISVQYLPIAQFVVKSTKEHDFCSIALPTVYIEDKLDSMEQVKSTAAMLNNLSDEGFITLDYDIELQNCDYNEYLESELFEYFKSTVNEGATKQNFLGDIADIYKGSIAPTIDYLKSIDYKL